MRKGIFLLLFILSSLLTLPSCTSNKDASDLTKDDLAFIQGLGILDEHEEIELFESNGGFKGVKQSGNFITDKRIASYWVDQDERTVSSAYFENEIDSITLMDLVSKPTYASYLTVYKTNGQHFKVYVDADSVQTYHFFETANDRWMKSKTNK